MCGVSAQRFTTEPSPVEAYLLGFLWADGSFPTSATRKGLYGVRLEILSSDFRHIHKLFRKTGKWGIRTRLRKNRSRSVTSASTSNFELHDHLRKLGYLNRMEGAAKVKSWLDALPVDLTSYWFRGYFDGDGSVYVNKKLHITQASVSGPFEQDWGFLTGLLNSLGINHTVSTYESRLGHKSSTVRVSNREACVKFGEYLYGNLNNFDGIGLKRKWNRFTEMKRTRWTAQAHHG